MCTAIHLCDEGLFGRTYDYEKSFGEKVVFTPRKFMKMGESKNSYAMLGVGVVKGESTLYFDGMNEWGLTGAALNFPDYAAYHGASDKKAEIPSGLVLSFVLGFCKSVGEIKALFENVGIGDESVCGLPTSPLHWIFADSLGACTVESTEDGLKVMYNPYGVLTNSPDFGYHKTRIADYVSLHSGYPENKLTKEPIYYYSRGMGAVGLPGDYSSSSRFIRALFVKENSIDDGTKQGNINRMRHILSSVSIPRGCVVTKEYEPVSTLYTCIMDMENLTYYTCSYDNQSLRGIRLYPERTDRELFNLYEKTHLASIN